MQNLPTATLHYTAPPVVGGVEAVIQAHAAVFAETGYPLTVITGRGEAAALPDQTGFVLIPEMDALSPQIVEATTQLNRGVLPDNFSILSAQLFDQLAPFLSQFSTVIVHNIFTKHFNLPLTAALFQLLDAGVLKRCIAWCHDFTWTSPNSRSKVFPGYPWELLRTYRKDLTYVTVSKARQTELAGLLGCPEDEIHVIYNGVDPKTLLGISPSGWDLISRLDLLSSDLILLMPVRVTQAKNIEFGLKVTAALKATGGRPKLIVTGPPDPHDKESIDYFHRLQNMRRDLDIEAEMRFVFEMTTNPEEPFTIDQNVVGDLYRVSDLIFVPSHREGFGMPILEAGLAGVAAASTTIPAAEEIGGRDILHFDPEAGPNITAEQVLEWMKNQPTYRLRQRVRQNFTWRAIFRQDIEPLLIAKGGDNGD